MDKNLTSFKSIQILAILCPIRQPTVQGLLLVKPLCLDLTWPKKVNLASGDGLRSQNLAIWHPCQKARGGLILEVLQIKHQLGITWHLFWVDLANFGFFRHRMVNVIVYSCQNQRREKTEFSVSQPLHLSILAHNSYKVGFGTHVPQELNYLNFIELLRSKTLSKDSIMLWSMNMTCKQKQLKTW